MLHGLPRQAPEHLAHPRRVGPDRAGLVGPDDDVLADELRARCDVGLRIPCGLLEVGGAPVQLQEAGVGERDLTEVADQPEQPLPVALRHLEKSALVGAESPETLVEDQLEPRLERLGGGRHRGSGAGGGRLNGRALGVGRRRHLGQNVCPRGRSRHRWPG
jgi:hypothetical protein